MPRTNPDLENRKTIRYRSGFKVVRSKGKVYVYRRNAKSEVRSKLDGWRSDAAKSMHKRTSDRAQWKGRTYSLSVAKIVQMLAVARDRCQVTGMNFDYRDNANPDWRTNPMAPSLDRISNAGGYDPENVRLVCTCVNYAINEFGLDTFDKMCRAFVAKNGNLK